MTSAAIAVALLLGAGQEPRRDAPKPAAGTGVLSGVVVTDDTERRPLRRVRVAVTSSDRETNRAVITDDGGAFAVTGLAAGRYTLQAVKAGWVTTSYGATRPMRPGTPIVLADGQRATGLAIRMPRGAVITGTIVDQNGEPAVGVGVTAMRRTIVNGAPQIGFSGRRVETDDRGTYRLFDLAAGDYVVGSTPAFSGLSGESIRLTSEADVRDAFAQVRSGGAPSSLAASADSSPPTIGYTAVFYPGTTSSAQAGIVTVSASQERGGVDFQLQLVATARIEGTVLMPDGEPLKSGSLNLTRTEQNIPGFSFGDGFRLARTDAEGHFSFAGIAPGQYMISSRAGQPSTPAPPGDSVPSPFVSRTPPLWAATDVAVEGQNIAGLTLTLQAGLTVSGRIALEPGALPPPALNRVRISLSAVLNPGEVGLGAGSATADASGQFSIEGVAPGRYKLLATVPGQRPDAPGWTAKSALLDGQDTLDFPAALKRSVEGVVTLTDKSTELSGLVRDASDQPAPEYFIIAFAADKQYWTQPSRRVQSVRPSANGRYQVRNLPPGDYLLVPLVDVEQGEWQDPSFLQRIAPGGIKVTLGEGEKKTQDIKVGGS